MVKALRIVTEAPTELHEQNSYTKAVASIWESSIKKDTFTTAAWADLLADCQVYR